MVGRSPPFILPDLLGSRLGSSLSIPLYAPNLPTHFGLYFKCYSCAALFFSVRFLPFSLPPLPYLVSCSTLIAKLCDLLLHLCNWFCAVIVTSWRTNLTFEAKGTFYLFPLTTSPVADFIRSSICLPGECIFTR